MASNRMRAINGKVARVVIMCRIRAITRRSFLRTTNAFAMCFRFVGRIMLAFVNYFGRNNGDVLHEITNTKERHVRCTISRCYTRNTTTMTLYRPKVNPVVRFIQGTTSASALANVTRDFKAKGRRRMVIHVIYREELMEHLRQFTRILTRIRNGMNRIFRRGSIVLNYRFTSSTRLFFFRTGPTKIIKVKVSSNESVTFTRMAFRLHFRLITAMIVCIGNFVFLSRRSRLLLLCQRAKVSRRGNVLFLVTLTTYRR